MQSRWMKKPDLLGLAGSLLITMLVWGRFLSPGEIAAGDISYTFSPELGLDAAFPTDWSNIGPLSLPPFQFPVNIVGLLAARWVGLSGGTGLRLMLLLAPLIGAAGMYLLARSHLPRPHHGTILGVFACGTAALLVGLNPWLFARGQHPSLALGMASMPLFVWAIGRAIRSNQYAKGMGAGLIFGLLLGGAPHSLVFGSFGALPYGIWRLASRVRRREGIPWRALGGLIIGSLAGSAYVLLPLAMSAMAGGDLDRDISAATQHSAVLLSRTGPGDILRLTSNFAEGDLLVGSGEHGTMYESAAAAAVFAMLVVGITSRLRMPLIFLGIPWMLAAGVMWWMSAFATVPQLSSFLSVSGFWLFREPDKLLGLALPAIGMAGGGMVLGVGASRDRWGRPLGVAACSVLAAGYLLWPAARAGWNPGVDWLPKPVPAEYTAPPTVDAGDRILPVESFWRTPAWSTRGALLTPLEFAIGRDSVRLLHSTRGSFVAAYMTGVDSVGSVARQCVDVVVHALDDPGLIPVLVDGAVVGEQIAFWWTGQNCAAVEYASALVEVRAWSDPGWTQGPVKDPSFPRQGRIPGVNVISAENIPPGWHRTADSAAEWERLGRVATAQDWTLDTFPLWGEVIYRDLSGNGNELMIPFTLARPFEGRIALQLAGDGVRVKLDDAIVARPGGWDSTSMEVIFSSIVSIDAGEHILRIVTDPSRPSAAGGAGLGVGSAADAPAVLRKALANPPRSQWYIPLELPVDTGAGFVVLWRHWNPGWVMLADGKITAPTALAAGGMAFPYPGGDSSLTLVFLPQIGLIVGLAILALAADIWLGMLWRETRR